MKGTPSFLNSTSGVQLGWDMVIAKAVTYDSLRFHTHQTIQWAVAANGWVTLSSWKRPLPSGQSYITTYFITRLWARDAARDSHYNILNVAVIYGCYWFWMIKNKTRTKQNTSNGQCWHPAASPSTQQPSVTKQQWFAVSLMTTWSQNHTTNMPWCSEAGLASQQWAEYDGKIALVLFCLRLNLSSSVPLKCMPLKFCFGTISQSLIPFPPECSTISQLVSHGH